MAISAEGSHRLHAGFTKSKKQDVRPVSEEYRTGAKSVLFTILKNADEPLTTAEIWEAAEVCIVLHLLAHGPSFYNPAFY